jgi:phenylalanyl-tRNA synthetase alpha subunit
MRKVEDEIARVSKQAREIEEMRAELADFKRRELTQLRDTLSSLQGLEERKKDRRIFENLLDEFQHTCRRVEGRYEREADQARLQSRQLAAHRESLTVEYRAAMKDKEE